MCDHVNSRAWAGLCATLWLAVTGCASVSPPDGGARDLTPPKLIRTEPANGATLVQGRTVRLFFDEDVTTTQLAQQLIVTPEIGKNAPIVKEEGRSFVIQFGEPFAPNTTYSLDFGETITDVTEKNKAERVTLAFSTGAVLDSGRLRGSVSQLLTSQPEAGAIIGLYPQTDSVNPARQKPFYRTISRKDGSFELSSLRSGKYRIFALADANKNQLYEEPERVAYLPEPVEVGSRSEPILLLTNRLDTRKPFISGREEGPGKAVIRYNEGINRASVISSTPVSFRIEGIGNQWLELFSAKNSQAKNLVIIAVDSSGNQKTDTLTVKFDGIDKTKGKAAVPTISINNSGQNHGVAELKFPVAVQLQAGATNMGRIERVKADKTIETVRMIEVKDVRLDSSLTKATVQLGTLKMPEGEKRQLWIDSTVWITTSQQAVRIPLTSVSLPESNSTGSVSGSITTSQTHYFVQLINEMGKVVQQERDGKTFHFAEVAPGKYRVRVLIDANSNGRWDGADPAFKRPTEPVFFHPDVLDVRANWEQEVKLSF